MVFSQKASIVAVHGLGANPEKTWLSRRQPGESGPQVNWLRDPHLLPSIVPHASIWTVNYDSRWLHNAPVQCLRMLAGQLLTFLHQNRVTVSCSIFAVFG